MSRTEGFGKTGGPGSGKDEEGGGPPGTGGAGARRAVRFHRRPPHQPGRDGAARAARYIRRRAPHRSAERPRRAGGDGGRDKAQPSPPSPPSHGLGTPPVPGRTEAPETPEERRRCAARRGGRRGPGARSLRGRGGAPGGLLPVPAGNTRPRRDPAGWALRKPPFPLRKYLSTRGRAGTEAEVLSAD